MIQIKRVLECVTSASQTHIAPVEPLIDSPPSEVLWSTRVQKVKRCVQRRRYVGALPRARFLFKGFTLSRLIYTKTGLWGRSRSVSERPGSLWTRVTGLASLQQPGVRVVSRTERRGEAPAPKGERWSLRALPEKPQRSRTCVCPLRVGRRRRAPLETELKVFSAEPAWFFAMNTTKWRWCIKKKHIEIANLADGLVLQIYLDHLYIEAFKLYGNDQRKCSLWYTY